MRIGVLVFPRATVALVRAHTPRDATIIAVDAGAEACRAAGIVPARIVGDMDSVSDATLHELASRGAKVERHPTAKDDTDAALALRHLADHDEIRFIGSAGGRADHALANLHLLASASAWARASAWDDDSTTWVVTPEHPLTLHLPKGALVSAIPFDAEVTGIRYEGLAYPLKDATMRAGEPYGISNVAAAEVQTILVKKGRLFVIQPLS